MVAEVADGNFFACNAGGKVTFLEICPNKRVVWRSPAGMSIPLGYVRRGNGSDVRRNRFVRWIFRAEVPSDRASWQLVEDRDPSPRRLRSPSLVGPAHLLNLAQLLELTQEAYQVIKICFSGAALY